MPIGETAQAARRAGFLQPSLETQTGRDGRYRLRGVPPGQYAVAAYGDAGRTVLTRVNVRLDADETSPIDLVVR